MTPRLLGPADAALWRQIRLLALSTAPDAFGEKHADWQHRPLPDFAAALGFRRTFAVIEGETALACAGWTDDRAGDPALCWLEAVFVRPAARGRGLGAAVIGAAVTDAARAGQARMLLGVGHRNLPALRLYHRLGFAILPGPGPRGAADEHTMARDLSA